tara:strand:+ start:1895 stop:2101 length:207 start_codon:yes stop_codon:yes gene_type:complete
MKTGDRIKILSCRDNTFDTGTIVEVSNECVKYKHDDIGGHFIVLKKMVRPFCDGCGCDPCDCDWGNHG